MTPRDWIAAIGLALFGLGSYMLAQQACLDSVIGCAASFLLCGGALVFFAPRIEFLLPVRKPERSCGTCKYRGPGTGPFTRCEHPAAGGDRLDHIGWQRGEYGKCGKYAVLWVSREQRATDPSAA